MKFRKKPVVIEAVTFEEFVEHGRKAAAALVDGIPWAFEYQGHAVTHENDDCYLIPTLEGTMQFRRGDMLITGVKGEIYPCKADIFAATYEAASVPSAGSSDTATGQAIRSYLETALLRGHIDHALRAEIDPQNGGVKFYIHPDGKDGDTMDVNMGPRQKVAAEVAE